MSCQKCGCSCQTEDINSLHKIVHFRGEVLTSARSADQWWCGFSKTRTSNSSASSLPACMYCSTAPNPVSRAAICSMTIEDSQRLRQRHWNDPAEPLKHGPKRSLEVALSARSLDMSQPIPLLTCRLTRRRAGCWRCKNHPCPNPLPDLLYGTQGLEGVSTWIGPLKPKS